MKNRRKYSEADTEVPRRHCPRRCALGLYHTGAAFLIIGIIISVVAVATVNLFYIDIYDHRRPANFLNVHISVGLFSTSSTISWLSDADKDLTHPLVIDNSNWIWARALTIVGILLAILSLILHFVVTSCVTNRKWNKTLPELICILFAVATFLGGLSLAEMEIQYIHDFGDEMFTDFLEGNQLLAPPPNHNLNNNNNNYNQIAADGFVQGESSTDLSGNTDDLVPATNGDFALSLSQPMSSFILLIVANSCFLLAFLSTLPYFVRLCEQAERERRQLKKANTETIV